jgi:hypothetical protein
MNKTLTINLGKWSLTMQLRDSKKTRKADFQVTGLDEKDKNDFINYMTETGAMDDIRTKAAAMKARRAAMAQG